jgi:hypothetical protein
MGMIPVPSVFQLQWATMALYGIDGNGNATGSALWQARCENAIQIEDELIEKITRPTATTYENVHHVNQRSRVVVSGLQDLLFQATLTTLQRNTYFVLYLQWIDSSDGIQGAVAPSPHNPDLLWTDRTYYFCTHQRLNAGASDAGPAAQSIAIRGQYYLQSSGAGSIPTGPYIP